MSIDEDILIVDRKTTNLRLLAEILENDGYRVRQAEKTQMAIDSALERPPSLIILDLKTSEMGDFEVCRRLNQDERTRDVPIIFVSSLENVEELDRGFEAGCIDFIAKPYREQEVLARVRTQTQLRRMQLNLGRLVEEHTSELSESKANLEALINSTDDSFCVRDNHGGLVTWNRAFAETVHGLCGTRPYDGMITWEHIELEPDFVEHHLQLMKRARAGETVCEEFGFDMPDGEERHFEITYAPVWEDDSVIGVAEFNRDITERKIAAIDLRQSQERYELAVAGSAAGLWDWDLASDTIHYSDRLQELLGYEPGEFSNSIDEFWDRLHPEDLDMVRSALGRHLEDRKEFIAVPGFRKLGS